MSFGFGFGDFLAVIELANKTKTKWVDAPAEYTSIKNEIKNVENILRNISEIGDEMDYTPKHEDDVKQACSSCRVVLDTCNEIVDKYSAIATSKSGASNRVRRAWKRFKLDPDDIRHAREQLMSVVTQLTALQEAIELHIINDVSGNVDDLRLSDEQREREAVADWYAPASFAQQHNDYLKRRHTGTGVWFLDDQRYTDWRAGRSSNSTLLCPGIPGSGKTLMVTAVVEDLRQQFENDEQVAVVYFYCNFNRQNEQELDHIYASLVRQLFQEKATIPSAVKAIYVKHRDRKSRPSLDELKSLLYQLSALNQTLFVVIDALDECSSNDRICDRLLDELFQLQRSNTKCKTNLLLSTRPIPKITARFSGCRELEVRAAKEDIECYLDNRMRELASFVTRRIDLQAKIKTQIVELSDGMFLLAKLHFETLIGQTNARSVKETLERLPRGREALSKAYDIALQRIDYQPIPQRDLAHRALMWISHARRELSIRELQEGLAIKPGMQYIDPEDDIDEEDEIVSACAGLVTVDQQSRTVRLIHYTTQEYLKAVRDQWLPGSVSEITKSCLSYLIMLNTGDVDTGFSAVKMLVEKNMLLEYSALNWGFHAAEVQDEETFLTIKKFLLDSANTNFAWAIIRCFDLRLYRWMGSGLLPVCTYFNMVRIVKDIVRPDTIIDITDSWGQISRNVAAICGHLNMVEYLCGRSDVVADSVDEDNRTPLSYAAENGHLDIVEYLCGRSDVVADSVNVYDRTPLSYAAENGHLDIVEYLCGRSDVVADSVNVYDRTPLSYAAEYGHLDIVEYLCGRSDVVADSVNVYDRTPLLYAAEYGHLDIVEYLCGRSDVVADSVDKDNRTSLSYAAENGHLDIVEYLCARPDVVADSKDCSGRTPMSYAAEHGSSIVVSALLTQHGVQVDSNDNGRGRS